MQLVLLLVTRCCLYTLALCSMTRFACGRRSALTTGKRKVILLACKAFDVDKEKLDVRGTGKGFLLIAVVTGDETLIILTGLTRSATCCPCSHAVSARALNYRLQWKIRERLLKTGGNLGVAVCIPPSDSLTNRKLQSLAHFCSSPRKYQLSNGIRLADFARHSSKRASAVPICKQIKSHWVASRRLGKAAHTQFLFPSCSLHHKGP